jgi:hypothetical protein
MRDKPRRRAKKRGSSRAGLLQRCRTNKKVSVFFQPPLNPFSSIFSRITAKSHLRQNSVEPKPNACKTRGHPIGRVKFCPPD